MTVWGMPGDTEWAQDQLAGARARLPAGAGGVEPPAPPAQLSSAPSGAEKWASVAAAEEASWNVDVALNKGSPEQAELALRALAADSNEYRAVRRKIDLWRNRIDILTRAMKERHPKLRIVHPTDHQVWDVTAIEPDGVTVANSGNGSSTRLEWGLL